MPLLLSLTSPSRPHCDVYTQFVRHMLLYQPLYLRFLRGKHLTSFSLHSTSVVLL